MRAKPDDPRWRWLWTEHDTAALGALAAILHGTDPRDVDAPPGFIEWKQVAADDPSEGPWVFELPEIVVRSIRGAELSSMAAAWARAPLMEGFGEAKLLEFLQSARAFVQDANGRVLYWEMS